MDIKGFNIDTYLKDLEYIVNIDSDSRNIEGIKKVAEYFSKKYLELGCFVETCTFNDKIGPCLKIENMKKDYYDVLIVGHMDTVFPKVTVAKRPFRIENNLAFGPGVSDMKSGLLMAYYLLKSLKEQEMLSKLSICILMNSDEEISSLGSTQWIKEHAKRSRFAFVLEPGRVDGSFVLKRKGTAKYEIFFKGIAAHAGGDPQNGRSAITEMAHWIIALDKLNDYDEGTTLNTGIASGGTAANVVAENAYMKVDARFWSMKEAEKIDEIIMNMSQHPAIEGVEVSVHKFGFREPMNPNENTWKLVELIENVGKEEGVDIRFSASGGASDGNEIAALGVPTIDGFGPIGTNHHRESEYLDISSVETRLKLMLKLVLGISANIIRETGG